MPFILTIVAIIMVAMGSALYFRSSTEPITINEPEQAPLLATSTLAESEASTPPEVVVSSPEPEITPPTQPIEPVVITPPTPTKPTPPPAVPTSTYADGSYTQIGYYRAPSGREAMTVSVTLKNDIVTSSTVSGQSDNRTSQRYIDKFVTGFGSYVTGKNIDRISLDVVSGGSLTPEGFMSALAAIKSEAKL